MQLIFGGHLRPMWAALQVQILLLGVGSILLLSVDGSDSTKLDFEAAFQGKCSPTSICEQKCINLHDGTFECDCVEGFTLDVNGYSCSKNNETFIETLPSSENVQQETVNFVGDDGLHEEAVQEVVYENQAVLVASLSDADDPKDAQPATGPVYSYGIPASRTDLVERLVVKDEVYAPTETPLGSSREPLGDACPPPGCGPGSCVYDDVKSKSRCQCPLGLGGDNCEEEIEIHSPKFSSHSWAEFPVLREAYETLNLVIEFKPSHPTGILFVSGENDDLSGDFFSVFLTDGYVEVRMDCGSGYGSVRSMERVRMNAWNRLEINRYRWDIYMVLNKGQKAVGRSRGLFSRITFCAPVFIGGGQNLTRFSDHVIPDGSQRGFEGCLRHLEVNNVPYRFEAQSGPGGARFGWDIDECYGDVCRNLGCQHGGKCMTSEGEEDSEPMCSCPLGYTGKKCETPIDLQVPSFTGSSYLKFNGLGQSASLHLEIILGLNATSPDGLILFNEGRRFNHSHSYTGDYVLLYLERGYPVFEFDLGNGPAILRSEKPITLSEWHEIWITRTGRQGHMRVDNRGLVTATAPGGYSQMSLDRPLFLGGVPAIEQPESPVHKPLLAKGFSGCIQKFVVNDKPIRIVGAAVGGNNVENCEHACRGNPCGEGATCLPQERSFTCACPLGRRGPRCTTLAVFEDSLPMMTGHSYLKYTDSDVVKQFSGTTSYIGIHFKTLVDGILLWAGEAHSISESPSQEFIALYVENGFAHFSFNLGGGRTVIAANHSRVDDNRWHALRAFRNEQDASLLLDETHIAYSSRSSGWQKSLDTADTLFIGGIEEGVISQGRSLGEHLTLSRGIFGCVGEVMLSRDYSLKLIPQASEGRNVEICR